MNTNEIHAWNTRIAAQEHASFLQSYEWGEFQRSIGREVLRIHCASAIRLPAWHGATYLYCPRGPIGDNLDSCIERFADYTRDLFVRFEPRITEGSALIKKCIKTHSVQPDAEWILDTTHGYRVLLTAMRPKTRYNIGLANKKGVQVRVIATKEDLRTGDGDIFVNMLAQSAGRGMFRLYPRPYYHALIHFFLEPNSVRLAKERLFARMFIAEHEGEPLAGSFVLFFGDTAYYLHGGTSVRKRELMAPYAMHAVALAETESLGYRYYNFGGITVSDDARHSWSGITKFKKGFSGELLLYPGTYDYPLQRWQYVIYKGGRTLWRFMLSSFNG